MAFPADVSERRPGLSPSLSWPCRTRTTSHSVGAHGSRTTIPLAAGRAQEARPFSKVGCGGHAVFRFGRLDPSGPDQDPAEWESRDLSAQAVFIIAPSMTTPLDENFQSATRSLRARATIVVFLLGPLLRFTRSRNQRLNPDVGWCRSHSQASWIMVDRSLGLPDLDTPCSCCTDPLCHGVGASPA